MPPWTWLNSVSPTPARSTPVSACEPACRARHYHRRDRAVSLADCVVAETARSLDAPVASSDPHLLDLCHDERIAVMVLPDSAGNMWSW